MVRSSRHTLLLGWLQGRRIRIRLIQAARLLPIQLLQVALANQILELSVGLQILTRLRNILVLDQPVFDLSFPHRFKCTTYLDPIWSWLRIAYALAVQSDRLLVRAWARSAWVWFFNCLLEVGINRLQAALAPSLLTHDTRNRLLHVRLTEVVAAGMLRLVRGYTSWVGYGLDLLLLLIKSSIVFRGKRAWSAAEKNRHVFCSLPNMKVALLVIFAPTNSAKVTTSTWDVITSRIDCIIWTCHFLLTIVVLEHVETPSLLSNYEV